MSTSNPSSLCKPLRKNGQVLFRTGSYPDSIMKDPMDRQSRRLYSGETGLICSLTKVT